MSRKTIGFYLAVILDVYSRGVRGRLLEQTLEKDLTIQALKKVLAVYSPPDIHRSDQGGQYATSKYTSLFPKTTQISMSKKGCPTENGIVEKFFRTFYDDSVEQIKFWLEVDYMTDHIHSSLSYMTPAEFESVPIAI